MAHSVHDVAGEIRRRLPDVGELKLHKLLYYAQGHHLATFGVPLFAESISAWDNGPVVGTLWWVDRNKGPQPPSAELGEAELNTLGYVLSRYGALTGNDLKKLTHSEPPWQDADRQRVPGESVRISTDAMQSHFLTAAREEDETGPLLDSGEIKALLDGAEERLREPTSADSFDELRARLAQIGG